MEKVSTLERAAILNWREQERFAVKRTIEQRLPELNEKVGILIDEMSSTDLMRLRAFHNRKIAPLVEAWLRDEYDDLRQSLQASAIESEAELGNGATNYAWTWDEALSAGVGTLMTTVAPVAFVPLAASFATVATTSLFVFSTSVVSIPILSAIVAGAVVTGLGGNRIRVRAFARRTKRYRTEVRQEIVQKALGDPKNPVAPSLCGRLQAEIDAVTAERLEQHK